MAATLCACRRGLEFRMYNERTRQPESVFSGAMRPQRCRNDAYSRVTRDIPVLDLAEDTPSRRNCDGSLRSEQGGGVQNGCGNGRCGEHGIGAQNGCGNGRCGGWGIEGHPLAMVYSPCQAWRGAYTPDVALARGTLFSELDLPFEPTGYKRGCM